MVEIYPFMSRRIVGNVFKLIGHNLENKEFLTEIPWNWLKMCTTNPKFLETTPNGLSVILVKFDYHCFRAALRLK